MIFKKDEDEFTAELEDHPIKDSNIYRLYYINYYRTSNHNIGLIDWPFKPFYLPEGMSRDDAFKVLSYLTDFLESNLELKECSHQSVSALDGIIDLERLGFKRCNDNNIHEEDIINLYTVTGRELLFKRSKHYPQYFEWYQEGITFEEVKAIYEKYGIDFYDPIIKNGDEPKSLKLIDKK